MIYGPNFYFSHLTLRTEVRAYRPSVTVPPYLGGNLFFDLYCHSLNPMSLNPSPELKSLFETALNEFEKRTDTNLVQHPIIDKLVNCESVESVISVLQEQAQDFRNFRGDDGKLMTWLKRTVSVLYTLSTSDVLCESISLVCVYSFICFALCNLFFFSLFHPRRQSLPDLLYFLAYVS